MIRNSSAFVFAGPCSDRQVDRRYSAEWIWKMTEQTQSSGETKAQEAHGGRQELQAWRLSREGR